MGYNDIFIEYACYDEAYSDKVRANVFRAIDMDIQGISVPVTHLSCIASLIPNGMVLSCPIDWPNGWSDTKSRITDICQAANKGVTAVDVVANQTLYLNNKHGDFMADLKAMLATAKEKDVSLRIMLNHRVIDARS